MLLSREQLRDHLQAVIKDKGRQGHLTEGLVSELAELPASYDALYDFAVKLSDLPMQTDWHYVEPNDLNGILEQCDPTRPRGVMRELPEDDVQSRIKAAFLGSVVGCILGKPLEINPTLEEIKAALEPLGEWPLNNYVTQKAAESFSRPPHPDWAETVREAIRYVAPDDDINYTIMGMLVLEKYGSDFTKPQLLELWLNNLQPAFTWGPERTLLAHATLDSLPFGATKPDTQTLETWVNILNPRDEFCGAMIRADAYGYACPGNPELAAKLAWRDASMTHRRTGIYGTMFAAAAIATAFVAKDALEIFETALKFVPQKSRFYEKVAASLQVVSDSEDWLEAYRQIHADNRQYSHCLVYQETGTLINTLKFATSIGDGICKQVMQGNDTDSYGATAGSILGAFFGSGQLEERWLKPFNDEIHVRLATFFETSLSVVTDRLTQLPGLIKSQSEHL